jgi:hypothetical protein
VPLKLEKLHQKLPPKWNKTNQKLSGISKKVVVKLSKAGRDTLPSSRAAPVYGSLMQIGRGILQNIVKVYDHVGTK